MSQTEEKKDLNTEFRSAISHALLGADCEASRETWDLVFSECEKIARQHHQSRLSEIRQKIATADRQRWSKAVILQFLDKELQQLKKAGMEEQVLEKANKINDRLKTINEELDRLESGSLRCDLSYGEGSKWVAIQGIDKDGLKDLLYKALSTKKKKLEEEFMNL